MKSAELEGSGIGSKRIVELNPDSGFSGVVVERVEDAPGGQCKVRYGSNWTPVGVSKAEHKATMETRYGQILDGIEASP